MKNKEIIMNRRSFIGAMLAAGSAPLIIPQRLLGADAPSNLLRIGCIGTGRMGFGNINSALGASGPTRSRLVAVCDVDLNRARQAKAHIDGRQGEGDEVAVFQDYGQMIESSNLDGVIISTPDFQHALMALACARAGLGMYLEKPLTYTVREGQALVKAVRENKVVLQTGSMQRSGERFHRVCWLVRNGRIGKLKEVRVQIPTDGGQAAFNPTEVPPHLDYDRWLGPAPFAPYSESRVHPQGNRGRPGFLQVEQYCLGMITGWGAHIYDIARWGIGPDVEAGPMEVTAKGDFPDRGVFDVHTNVDGEARLANGVVIKSSTARGHLNRFIGEDGWLSVHRGGFEASNPEILRERPSGGIELATSSNHMRNFLECLRTGADPVAPVEEGHRTNNLCVMHWIAMKLGRKIVWDPTKGDIVGDQEANRMLHYAYREGYGDPGIVYEG